MSTLHEIFHLDFQNKRRQLVSQSSLGKVASAHSTKYPVFPLFGDQIADRNNLRAHVIVH